MAGQARVNNDLTQFVLAGLPHYKTGTIAQDAGRSAVLEQYTVMAYDADAGKWVPWTDVDDIVGAHKPRGIYVGPEIAAATLVAGDVTLTGEYMLVGGKGLKIDKNKLVFENSLTLATTFAGVNFAELTTQFAALVASVNAMIDIFDAHVHDGVTTGSGDTGAPTTTMTDADAVLDDAERIDDTAEEILRDLGIFCGDVVDASGHENA